MCAHPHHLRRAEDLALKHTHSHRRSSCRPQSQHTCCAASGVGGLAWLVVATKCDAVSSHTHELIQARLHIHTTAKSFLSPVEATQVSPCLHRRHGLLVQLVQCLHLGVTRSIVGEVLEPAFHPCHRVEVLVQGFTALGPCTDETADFFRYALLPDGQLQEIADLLEVVLCVRAEVSACAHV